MSSVPVMDSNARMTKPADSTAAKAGLGRAKRVWSGEVVAVQPRIRLIQRNIAHVVLPVVQE